MCRTRSTLGILRESAGAGIADSVTAPVARDFARYGDPMAGADASVVLADVAIVGAGPAGLGAWAFFREVGAALGLRVVMLEAGVVCLERKRDETACVGVGGAGLFSDGKV